MQEQKDDVKTVKYNLPSFNVSLDKRKEDTTPSLFVFAGLLKRESNDFDVSIYFQCFHTVDWEMLARNCRFYNDRCEIRTRATEVTGALNQRLRPLGQSASMLPPRELESVCKLPLAFTLIENKGREDAPRYQGYTGCSSYGASRSSVNDLYNHHTVDWKW